MSRARPLYVRQLFAWLTALGWSQKQCADVMGVSPQAVNNWASGGMSIPVRYRQAIVDLVDRALVQALLEAASHPDPAFEECTKQGHEYLTLWHDENQMKGGYYDEWYGVLLQQLACLAKTPLSAQSVEDLRKTHLFHLNAARHLRYMIQIQEATSLPEQEKQRYDPEQNLFDRLQWYAEYFAGQRFPSTPETWQRHIPLIRARLTEEERGKFDSMLATRPRHDTMEHSSEENHAQT
jgi:transcriptional regulator with XRE-family HTH domain